MNRALQAVDPEVWRAIRSEADRQQIYEGNARRMLRLKLD